MKNRRRAAGLAPAACLLLTLYGCATRGPLLPDSPSAVELDGTPFYPQLAHQCGPAALATVLSASGVAATPEALAPLVYLPGKRGSLQIEMQAAPRRYSRLAYTLDPELTAITGELDAGRPVLVLHNYGVPFWPRWHYAVAIGYDPRRDTVVLRSGTTRRQVLSARFFMRAWDNGGRWAMVLLRPGELPAVPDRRRYLQLAAAFERTARPPEAREVFDSALRQWPDEPLAWIGRGTANYKEGGLSAAADDYRAALRLDPAQAGARNNLAMALLEQGCPHSARQVLDSIDSGKLSASLVEAIRDTRARLAALGQAADTRSCGSP